MEEVGEGTPAAAGGSPVGTELAPPACTDPVDAPAREGPPVATVVVEPKEKADGEESEEGVQECDGSGKGGSGVDEEEETVLEVETVDHASPSAVPPTKDVHQPRGIPILDDAWALCAPAVRPDGSVVLVMSVDSNNAGSDNLTSFSCLPCPAGHFMAGGGPPECTLGLASKPSDSHNQGEATHILCESNQRSSTGSRGRQAHWFTDFSLDLFPKENVFLGVKATDIKCADGSPLTLEWGQLVYVRGAGDRCFVVVGVGQKWGKGGVRVALLVMVPDEVLQASHSDLEASPAAYVSLCRKVGFSIAQLANVTYEIREHAPAGCLAIVHAFLNSAANPDVAESNIDQLRALDPNNLPTTHLRLLQVPPSADKSSLELCLPHIPLSTGVSGNSTEHHASGTPDGPAAARGKRAAAAAKVTVPAAAETQPAKKNRGGGAQRQAPKEQSAPTTNKARSAPAAPAGRSTRTALLAAQTAATASEKRAGMRGGSKGAAAMLPETWALATVPQRAKSPDVQVIDEPSAPPAQRQPQQEPQMQSQTQRQPLHDITGAAQHLGMPHNGMLVPIHQLGGAPLGGLQLGHVGVGAGMQPWPMMPHGGSMVLPMLMTNFHAQNAAAAVRAAQDEARAATQNQLMLACMYGGQWCGPPQGAPPFQDAPK